MSSVPGVLEVFVSEGRELANKELFGKMDPYVVIRVGNETKKTNPVNHGGRNPIINQSLRFDVIPGITEIYLEAYDKDVLSDDFIGSGTVELGQAFQTGNLDTRAELRGRNGKHAGDIRLVMTFTAHAGRPAGAPQAQYNPQYAVAPTQMPPQAAAGYPGSVASAYPPPQPQYAPAQPPAQYGAYGAPQQPPPMGYYGAPPGQQMPPQPYPPNAYGAPPPGPPMAYGQPSTVVIMSGAPPAAYPPGPGAYPPAPGAYYRPPPY